MRRSTGFAALILVWVLAINASAKDTPPVSPPPPNASPGPSLKAGRPEAAPENSQLDTDRLERSRAAWLKAKAACGGDYSYVVRFQSAFGFGHATTITVRDGKVIQRMFEQWSRPEPREPGAAPQPLWVETGKEIGSHAEAGVAQPLTLDELYDVAKTVVETQPAAGHVRSLGIDERGLLQHCSIRDTRIADDAPQRGVPPFELTLDSSNR
jgi:hypothetical protein